ncbi:MAG TPA: exopolysaccharide biosynthesis GT4 family glycosyltransferase EpsE [Thermosynechococcaceae cyanobacterium]
MKTRIGYLIPEFPGQTHIFFWRERQVLTELGIDTDLVSTRRPPKAIASHTWAAEAQTQTAYLAPFQSRDLFGALLQVIKAGPIGWGRCLQLVASAPDLSLRQKSRLLAMVLVGGKLVWLGKTRGWQHIHVHSCADAANIAMFAAVLSDLTYSITLHGPTLSVYGPNQRQKWRHSEFALVISQQLFKFVNRELAGALPNQVAVAPMGVNLEQIKRHIPYTSPQPGQVCRIFACGRLNPVKGHNYLISTIASLLQRGFKVHLQIAGEDEQGGSGYHRELERMIQARSLSEHVELLGAVSEGRIRQGLEDAHVFALASLNEGIPVSVMEAMAMELPVVVTDVGGNSELIDSGVDGILVPSEDPDAMTEAIAQLLQDPDFACRLSRASRKKITEKFSHRRSAEALAQCLGVL